jgi:acetoacetyl-CoA synthetase
MAQNYISELKKLQPRGPYLLCGHSFGGLVVFEIAQQLIAAGEKIDILLLLDTQINPSFWPVSYFISILLTRLRHHVSVLFSLPPNQLSSYITRTIQMMVNWFLYFLRLKKPMPLPVSELTPEFATARNAQLVAMANYRPSFYPSKMIYFRATDPSSTDPNVLWRKRVSELEVHVVTGGHCSMLEYPYLDNLVSTMQKCLPR